MPTITYPHIELNADCVPVLSGTRTKVIEIVLDRLAHRWDADEIQRQHPHLRLAQIHAALTYYYDHQDEMDRDIEARRRRAEQMEADLGDSTVRDKLRRLGHLP